MSDCLFVSLRSEIKRKSRLKSYIELTLYYCPFSRRGRLRTRTVFRGRDARVPSGRLRTRTIQNRLPEGAADFAYE